MDRAGVSLSPAPAQKEQRCSGVSPFLEIMHIRAYLVFGMRRFFLLLL